MVPGSTPVKQSQLNSWVEGEAVYGSPFLLPAIKKLLLIFYLNGIDNDDL
jgi:hypothetical protein